MDDVFADFEESFPYGVRWWPHNLSSSRRILIADQLYCCLSSVPKNMTEAALHWHEYLDVADRDSARLAYAVKMLPDGPYIDPPRPDCPADHLLPALMEMHQAGLIRAIASSLDCLAGAIIGIAALPLDLLKADFNRTRSHLVGVDGLVDDGSKMQACFATQLESAIEAAGPKGWVDWTLDLRNMLVHRGRRIELGQYLPITPNLFGPDGQPVIRVRRVSHLPRDPGRSDIEVRVQTPRNIVLDEESTHTLEGVMNSTLLLLETTASHLLDVWRWRRSCPSGLIQPVDKQWPKGVSRLSTGFQGYAPGSLPAPEGRQIEHPTVVRRFRAASVDDECRSQWDKFD